MKAAGRPVSKGLKQQAEAEQSGDMAVMLGFERPSRKRRVELFGKAIDPWDPKQAEEERRREGLRPVYFGGLGRSLGKWASFCWPPLVVIVLLVASDAYLNLHAFKQANLSTIQHIQSCRKAAVELETATFSRNLISSTGGEREPLLEAEQDKKETHAENTYLECQLWARSGFGVAPR
jgi:hypothetical protein